MYSPDVLTHLLALFYVGPLYILFSIIIILCMYLFICPLICLFKFMFIKICIY